ncbi:hypothetical protein BD309DRAFT_115939 [Dichomitus squalens]|nr:hypothetical protein BD309DRAFT_115939 [Dichomitus squalens]
MYSPAIVVVGIITSVKSLTSRDGTKSQVGPPKTIVGVKASGDKREILITRNHQRDGVRRAQGWKRRQQVVLRSWVLGAFLLYSSSIVQTMRH